MCGTYEVINNSSSQIRTKRKHTLKPITVTKAGLVMMIGSRGLYSVITGMIFSRWPR
jgi:hypothetical protein